MLALPSLCQAQSAPSNGPPVSISIYDRTRVNTWQWFAAPPKSEAYGYVESLVRLSIAQQIRQWDWQLELVQPAVLGLPNDAVSTVTAQGQLGLGGTYYASNSNNTEAAAAFLKQGFVRYHFADEHTNLRVGRFEFIEGQGTKPANATLGWLQTNRIAHRLIGNFAFSNAQRSLDGLDDEWTTEKVSFYSGGESCKRNDVYPA